MKFLILAPIVLLFNFKAKAQCPPTLSSSGNGNCFDLTLSPQPASVSINGQNYNRVGQSTNYGQCNGMGNSPGTAASGTFTINGNTCTYSSGILPLSFLTYRGSFADGILTLSWSTVKEENISHFMAEISENGSNWKQYDVRSENLTSRNNVNQYNGTLATDIQPNYVRIIGVDVDGTENKTPVFLPNNIILQKFDVYPNPTSGNILNFSCFDCDPRGSTIEIFSPDGKTIQKFKGILPGTPLDISSFSKGLYFLTVEDAKMERQIIKFIKE